MWTIDAADVVAENMFGEPRRIAAVRAADVTGAVGVQLVNIFEPFALKIFVEWHCLRCETFIGALQSFISIIRRLVDAAMR